MKMFLRMTVLGVLLASPLAIIGCSKNVCQQACDKLKDCGATTCDSSNCDGAAKTYAQCIVDNGCAGLLTCSFG